MTLQDFITAAYERRIHGRQPPPGLAQADFVDALRADPALLVAARAKLAEYAAVISTRGRSACYTTAVSHDVLAETLTRLNDPPNA